MKAKLFLGILFVAAAVVPVQAQLCGPGGVIRGYTAYPAPAYVAPSPVYAPAAPVVVVAPPVAYQPRVVYYGGGGYYPHHYSPPVHLSFGLGYHGGWNGHSRGGYWGGGHFGGGHGGWRH